MAFHDLEPGVKHNTLQAGPARRLAHSFWSSGAALITTAAFLFSCTSLAVKLLGTEVPTFQVALVPGLICFFATSALVKAQGLNIRSKSWRIAGLTLLRGLLGATSITCFYLAIELLPLQDAVTLFFSSPVVAALLELVVTGESHGWAGAAATACTVTGVVLVSQPECVFSHFHGPGQGHQHGSTASTGSGTSAAGVVLATSAAVANAAAFVVVRLIHRSQSTVVLTWWYHGVVVVVSAVPLALGYPLPAVVPSLRGCALLAVVGVTQFLGQLLLNRGFQLESATRGSAINVLQVLFSFMWDVTVLGDQPDAVGVAGSSLVAAGVLCVALTGKPPHHGQAPEAHHHHHHHHRTLQGGRSAGDANAGSGFGIDSDDGDLEEAGGAMSPLLPTVRHSGARETGSSCAAAAAASDAAARLPGSQGAGSGGGVVVELDADATTEGWLLLRARGGGRHPGGGSAWGGAGGGSSIGESRSSSMGLDADALQPVCLAYAGADEGPLRQPLLGVAPAAGGRPPSQRGS